MKGFVMAGVVVLVLAVAGAVGAVCVSHMPVVVTLAPSVCKPDARHEADKLLEPGDYPCKFEAYVSEARVGAIVWGVTGSASGQCLLVKNAWVRSVGKRPVWHRPMWRLPPHCAANFAVYRPRYAWVNWSMVRAVLGWG